MKSPFAVGSESPIDGESALLKPYFDHQDNKAVVLKMLQDPQLVAGYNLFSSSNEAIQNTLMLFSYGTMKDYESNPSKYIPLGEPQLNQLRRLAVLQVLQDKNSDAVLTIPYSDFPNPEDLELHIAHLVGIGAISARLSQRNSAVCLQEIHRPRDISPTDGTILLAPLCSMLQQVSQLQVDLDETMNQVIRQQKQQEELEKRLDPMLVEGEEYRKRHRKRGMGSTLHEL